MRNILIHAMVLLMVLPAASRVQAQNASVSDIMESTLSKLRASSDAGRITEKTYSDIFFKDDTTRRNCIFSYRFSASNTYRINAFALSEQVSNIDAVLYQKDGSGNWTVVGKNSGSGNDVNFRFTPRTSGFYSFVIRGTLRGGINNALFNLIIERE